MEKGLFIFITEPGILYLSLLDNLKDFAHTVEFEVFTCTYF